MKRLHRSLRHMSQSCCIAWQHALSRRAAPPRVGSWLSPPCIWTRSRRGCHWVPAKLNAQRPSSSPPAKMVLHAKLCHAHFIAAEHSYFMQASFMQVIQQVERCQAAGRRKVVLQAGRVVRTTGLVRVRAALTILTALTLCLACIICASCDAGLLGMRFVCKHTAGLAMLWPSLCRIGASFASAW